MAIWHQDLTLDEINQRNQDSMVDYLGIEFIEITNDYLKASMPVDHRTRQPIGILHGGASCVLAETVGSNAANFVVDIEKFYCVGLSINTNHIRSIQEGLVIATAIPDHLGKTTHVWDIDIHSETGRLISRTTLTMAVLKR